MRRPLTYGNIKLLFTPPFAKGGKGGFECLRNPPQSPFAKGGGLLRRCIEMQTVLSLHVSFLEYHRSPCCDLDEVQRSPVGDTDAATLCDSDKGNVLDFQVQKFQTVGVECDFVQPHQDGILNRDIG